MKNIAVKILDKIYNWARANSLSPLLFSSSCCGIEVEDFIHSDNNTSGFGTENFKTSPKQADLLIVAGTVTYKNAPVLLKTYEQMAEPKYVIAVGECACSGGIFKDNSYSVVCGADKIIPVDVQIPMCPPSQEALANALEDLKQKIKTETLEDRHKYLLQNQPKLEYNDGTGILTTKEFQLN